MARVSLFTSLVQERARNRCEYCQMHQSLQGATFHIEHIVPASKGGETSAENLAWCCPSCNLHKSNKTAATDPLSGEDVAIFHPRHDRWADHFGWHDSVLIGLTAMGRATIGLLELNTERRQLIRRAEARFGLFPP